MNLAASIFGQDGLAPAPAVFHATRTSLVLRNLPSALRDQFGPLSAALDMPPPPPTPAPTGSLQPGKYIVPQDETPHVIPQGTELAFLNLDGFDRGDVQVREGSLVNNGVILSVTDSIYGTMALSTRGQYSNATASIVNNGSIYAHGTNIFNGPAWGIYTVGVFSTITNAGLIQSVSDHGRATGITGSFTLHNTVDGVIRVHAQAGALGVAAGLIDNDGLIEVVGGEVEYQGGGAFAVRDPSAFDNSGTIRATSYSDFFVAVGVMVDEVLLQEYVNSGTIIAQYAYYDQSDRAYGRRHSTFLNSGSIVGDMVFGKDSNTLLNTGSIDGNVFFDNQWTELAQASQDPNVYDGRGGSLLGGLYLGLGSTNVWLGDGGEEVYTGGGKDSIVGGAGDDLVDVFGGVVTATGGDGFDILSWYSATAEVTVDIGAGTASGAGQTTTFAGFEGYVGSAWADTFMGSNSADYILGGDGDDIITGGGGNDDILGGSGTDTAVFSGARSDHSVNVGSYVVTVSGPDGIDVLSGVEWLQFADQRIAAAKPLNLTGTVGDDTLNGSPLDDVLAGGAGNDTITGGAGNDIIDGGSGHDVVIVSGTAADYRLMMNGDDFILKGPDGRDSLTNVETIRFGDGRELELNRMYGADLDATGWGDGRIPEHLLSDGTPGGPLIGDRSEVMPGADDAGPVWVKGFDQPEVMPTAEGDFVLTTGFEGPLVLPAVLDDRLTPGGFDPGDRSTGWRMVLEGDGLPPPLARTADLADAHEGFGPHNDFTGLHALW
jgi:hypothetical protein